MVQIVMQALNHEPSESHCRSALARRRNQKPPVVVTHPVTGNHHVVNTWMRRYWV